MICVNLFGRITAYGSCCRHAVIFPAQSYQCGQEWCPKLQKQNPSCNKPEMCIKVNKALPVPDVLHSEMRQSEVQHCHKNKMQVEG